MRGGGESRVKTFCKNLFHKRCCSPRGRERLRSLRCPSRLARGGQELGAFPPPQPPLLSQETLATLGFGAGVGDWEGDPYKGNKVLSVQRTPSTPIFTRILFVAVSGSTYFPKKLSLQSRYSAATTKVGSWLFIRCLSLLISLKTKDASRVDLRRTRSRYVIVSTSWFIIITVMLLLLGARLAV